jgi:hypothetical protein
MDQPRTYELGPGDKLSDWEEVGGVEAFVDAGERPARRQSTPDEIRAAAQRLGLRIVYTPSETPIGSALAEIVAFLRRFLILPSWAHVDALALWVAHTYVMDAFEATMYLAITSPEKGSGKTRVLEVLELLVHRPWRVTTPSESVLFSNLAQRKPTLLLDEVDAVFSKNRETEGLRAVLNIGNRRGAVVPRVQMVGQRREIRDFPVFGAKALAGIGAVPETIADRSIPIPMQRRLATEPVERLIIRDVRTVAAGIQENVRAATGAVAGRIAAYRVGDDFPPELSDRQLEGWETLFAVADSAGGDWPGRARAAAVAVHSATTVDASDDLLLLEHVRDAFAGKDVDRLATSDLLDYLRHRDDGPWARWWPEDFDAEDLKGASGLASHLKRYGIRSRKLRLDERRTAKGYLRTDFEPVWARYLSTVPVVPPGIRVPERP